MTTEEPSNPGRTSAALWSLIGNYGLTAVAIAEGLIVTPLCLHYIDSAAYGAWLATGDVLAWLAVFDMGLGTMMVQRISHAHARQDMKGVRTEGATGMLALCGMVTVLISVAIAISGRVPGFFHVSGVVAAQLSKCFVIAAFSVSLAILNNGISGFSTALQRVAPVFANNFVSGVLGPCITVFMLMRGYGLVAIPTGLLVRNAFLCGANLLYAAVLYGRTGGGWPRATFASLKWYTSTASTVFLGKLSGILLARCDVLVVAAIVRPEAATALVLTRRAADIVRMVLDRFAGSLYAPFAHLAGSGDTLRVRQIARAVCSVALSISLVGTAIYIAFNSGFLKIWLGTPIYGDRLLTVLLAGSTVTLAANSLLNYLYSATGELRRGSLLALWEVPARLVLLGIFVRLFSACGAPAAALVTANIINFVLVRRLAEKLSAERGLYDLTASRVSVYALIILSGLTLSFITYASPLTVLVPLGVLYGSACMAAVWAVDPHFRALLVPAWKVFTRRYATA